MEDHDTPDLTSFTIDDMKQYVEKDAAVFCARVLRQLFNTPTCCVVHQEVRERGDQALLRKPVLPVQHEVHHLADGHVCRPPGLALQAEPRREGRQ